MLTLVNELQAKTETNPLVDLTADVDGSETKKEVVEKEDNNDVIDVDNTFEEAEDSSNDESTEILVLKLLVTAKNDLEDVREESQSDRPEGEADDTSLGHSPDDAPPSVKSLSGVPDVKLSQDSETRERDDDRCLGLPDGSRCR